MRGRESEYVAQVHMAKIDGGRELKSINLCVFTFLYNYYTTHGKYSASQPSQPFPTLSNKPPQFIDGTTKSAKNLLS